MFKFKFAHPTFEACCLVLLFNAISSFRKNEIDVSKLIRHVQSNLHLSFPCILTRFRYVCSPFGKMPESVLKATKCPDLLFTQSNEVFDRESR